jgi:hypothetical protein
MKQSLQRWQITVSYWIERLILAGVLASSQAIHFAQSAGPSGDHRSLDIVEADRSFTTNRQSL